MDAESLMALMKAYEGERTRRLVALGAAEVALREAQGNVRECDGKIEVCRYWLSKLKGAPAPSEEKKV